MTPPPESPAKAIDAEALIVWLKQAALDYREGSYRPTAHYMRLFEDAGTAITRLTQQREDFYMRYRMQCDEETKAALIRAEAAEAALARLAALGRCQTHGDPLVCLACEAKEDAHPVWQQARCKCGVPVDVSHYCSARHHCYTTTRAASLPAPPTATAAPLTPQDQE
jgi:hypothetical protein